MARAMKSVIIMIVSAAAGTLVGSAINGAETCAVLFAMIAGFACIIHTIETQKKD